MLSLFTNNDRYHVTTKYYGPRSFKTVVYDFVLHKVVEEKISRNYENAKTYHCDIFSKWNLAGASNDKDS